MFANWHAELNLFCLATSTPVSGVSQYVAKKQRRMFAKKKMENMRVRAGFCSCRVFCVVCYSLLQANSVCDQKKSGKEKSKQGLALYLVLLQCVADQFSVVLQFCQKKIINT